MFNKQEIQLIGKTLTQRRDWLIKSLDNPELSGNRAQHQQTIQLLDNILDKLGKQLQNNLPEVPVGDSQEVTRVNHFISQRATPSSKQAAQIRRQQLMPEQIRVLVVDDDNFLIELVKAILNSAGITRVDLANDGMKAVNMLYEATPIYDLVLCDWHMPEKNGIDVHTAMRASERYLNAIFMLVTAVTEASQIREAIDEGVDDYVVKPLEQEKMLRKIARHFPQVKFK